MTRINRNSKKVEPVEPVEPVKPVNGQRDNGLNHLSSKIQQLISKFFTIKGTKFITRELDGLF